MREIDTEPNGAKGLGPHKFAVIYFNRIPRKKFVIACGEAEPSYDEAKRIALDYHREKVRSTKRGYTIDLRSIEVVRLSPNIADRLNSEIENWILGK